MSEKKGTFSEDSLFYHIFDSTSDSKLLIRSETGEILHVNKNFEDVFGYRKTEICGKQITEVDFFSLDLDFADTISKQQITIKTKENQEYNALIRKNHIIHEGIHYDIFTIPNQTTQLVIENSLKDTSVLFQHVIEQLPYPIAISDNLENNLYVNPIFTSIFGYTIEDIPTTEHWVNLVYPDKQYRKQIQEKLPKVTDTIGSPRISNVTCKNGQIRQIIFRDVNISDQKFITIFEDLSEKIQTQKKVKKLQQQFEKIVELIPFPIGVSDFKDNLVYLNPSFINTFGYTLQDIPTGNDWMRLAYPNEEYRESIPTASIFNDRNISTNRIRKVKCKDGLTKQVIFRDLKIENEYEVTVGYDITEQKRIEQIIRDQQKEYREIVEDASDMIFRVDMNRILTSINPACTLILGYSQQELIGRDFMDLVPAEFRALIDQKGNAKIYGNSTQTIYEIELFRKNGERLSVEMSSRLLKRDGKFIGVQAIARDITERKRINEERIRQQKLESLNLLAGGIAHDYNNILVAILGNVNLLQMEELNSEQIDILTDLEQGTLRARDLTKQLLSFSKGGKPQKAHYDVTDIIKESVSFVMRGSKSTHEFHFDAQLPLVEIDSSQINQVINNLIINADQSMPHGGVIKIYVNKVILQNQNAIPLKDGDYVKIAIKDFGGGIPKNIHHKIFEPYFTTKKSGNGLGLASSYSIISKHEGHMTFLSKENIGTVFYVYLPVSKKPHLNTEKKETEIYLNPGKVILLDDDKTIHRFIERFLKKTNSLLESYFSGEVFLEKMAQSTLPLKNTIIIMDLTIPGGMGGREAIESFRKLDLTTPVIVSSGYENDPYVANFKKYGFTDILIKPYSITQLKTIISKHI